MSSNYGHIWQEFSCRRNGGGCKGFILIRFNLKMNRRIKIICPNCKHSHQRIVRDGQVYDDGYRDWKCDETFTPLKSAWSKTPRTKHMQLAYHRESGDAAVLKGDEIQKGGSFLRQSWLEWAAGKLIGKD